MLLAVSAVFATIPGVKAADVPTYAFLAVNPNPVGINQQVQVSMWMSDPPPTAVGPAGDRWQGIMLTILKPDGSTETKGPYTSDAVGGAYYVFNPTAIGTYSFQWTFPGQHIQGMGVIPPIPLDNQYLASTSNKIDLVVQEQQVVPPPEVSVPTDYWTRPINGMNYLWASISGDWLMAGWDTTSRAFDGGSCFAPNTQAPNTAHILWTKPITLGGLIGDGKSASYYTGQSYEQYFKPPIIIDGVLYYNTPTAPYYGFTAVDMRTGKELWWHNGSSNVLSNSMLYNGGLPSIGYPQLTLGQVYNFMSPNQGGGYAYLWTTPDGGFTSSVFGLTGGTWSMYDAFKGDWILDINNVPAGTAVFGKSGEILIYSLDATTNTLALWNSSKAIPFPPFAGTVNTWMWRPPVGSKLDGTKGVEWNVSIPAIPGLAISKVGDAIFAQSAVTGTWVGFDKNTGARLWTTDLVNPSNLPNDLVGFGSFTNSLANNGMYFEYVKQTMQWVVFDLKTGTHMWTSDPYTNPWGFYNTGDQVAYGNFYASGYDGMVHCYDLATGAHKWDFSSGNAGTLTPYGTWPLYNGITIADNKVFATTGEHGNGVQPMYLGEKIFAIDATNGNEVWSLKGWFEQPVISDGYLVSHNGYDNLIYCIGKGPSDTTVSVSSSVISKGATVLIQGTVTDQSPGATGTPCVSKDNMAAWMEYLYEQQPMPTHVTGVPVQLSAHRSDGSSIVIGTVNSDTTGYKFAWTPPDSDLYTIVASFAGDGSYGSSMASTGLSVGAAAEVSDGSTASSAPLDLYIIIATIVLLIAIAIAVVLIRRK